MLSVSSHTIFPPVFSGGNTSIPYSLYRLPMYLYDVPGYMGDIVLLVTAGNTFLQNGVMFYELYGENNLKAFPVQMGLISREINLKSWFVRIPTLLGSSDYMLVACTNPGHFEWDWSADWEFCLGHDLVDLTGNGIVIPENVAYVNETYPLANLPSVMLSGNGRVYLPRVSIKGCFHLACWVNGNADLFNQSDSTQSISIYTNNNWLYVEMSDGGTTSLARTTFPVPDVLAHVDVYWEGDNLFAIINGSYRGFEKFGTFDNSFLDIAGQPYINVNGLFTTCYLRYGNKRNVANKLIYQSLTYCGILGFTNDDVQPLLEEGAFETALTPYWFTNDVAKEINRNSYLVPEGNPVAIIEDVVYHKNTWAYDANSLWDATSSNIGFYQNPDNYSVRPIVTGNMQVIMWHDDNEVEHFLQYFYSVRDEVPLDYRTIKVYPTVTLDLFIHPANRVGLIEPDEMPVIPP